MQTRITASLLGQPLASILPSSWPNNSPARPAKTTAAAATAAAQQPPVLALSSPPLLLYQTTFSFKRASLTGRDMRTSLAMVMLRRALFCLQNFC